MKILLIFMQSPSTIEGVFAAAGIIGLLQLLFGLFVIYQVIRYASGKDKIIKNQIETIRLLRKIAGEPEITKSVDEDSSND